VTFDLHDTTITIPGRSRNLVLSLVSAALFMELLDGTIIATALPQMAKSFNVSAVSLNIGMTAYMLTLAVFIPISGWLADHTGERTVFASAIGVFTAASVFCGVSQGMWEFTAARVLQGVGGAMMVPVGRLIVLRSTPKSKLTDALARMTWPALVAPVIGPPLGGLITAYASWRWIFFLNVPLGIVALLLTYWLVANEKSAERHQFDWRTFLLAGSASTCLVIAFEQIAQGRGSTLGICARLALGLSLGTAAVLGARPLQNSLIDFNSLRLPTFAQAVYGGSLFRAGVSVLPFLLPLMFQIEFGYNAFRSGLFLLALFAGDLLMKAAVVRILMRWGFRRVMMVNGVLTSISIVILAGITPRTPQYIIVAMLAVHGAFRSLQFTAIGTLAYLDVPRDRMSRANAFLSGIAQLSSGMGVALGAVLLHTPAIVRGSSGNIPALQDFRFAFLVVSVFILVSMMEAFRLPRVHKSFHCRESMT
jgi:EmrB/QacA subfamily drug resistance transporter